MAVETLKKYGPYVEELLENLSVAFGDDSSTDSNTIKYMCDRLFEYAADNQSDELFALYYKYYIRYLVLVGEDTNLENRINESIKFQLRANAFPTIVEQYLYAADNAGKYNDALRQIIFLFNAYDTSRQYNLYVECGDVANKLSKIYYQAGYYDKAIEYCEKAEECMEMSGHWSMDREEYCLLLINKGNTYIKANRMFEAGKIRKQLEEYAQYMEGINRDYPSFIINAFMARYAYLVGDKEALDVHLYLAGEKLDSFRDYDEHQSDVKNYIFVLYETGQYDRLIEVLDYFISLCRQDEASANVANYYYQKRIELAIMMSDSSTAYEIGLELLSLFEMSKRNSYDIINSAENRYKEVKENEKHQAEMLAKNEQLREDMEKAKTENEAKTSFISSMSHEIRTPINAVLGLDEMILRESTEDDVKVYAQDILNAGKNLLSIVNDILDFSKLEAGKMEIVPEEYQVAGMVRDLINLISPRAKAKDLPINLDIDPKLPSKLYGDDVRIKQVITNLLTNAVKYSETGHIDLAIDYEEVSEDTISMIVSVKDTGIGMKEEEIDKLFKPFERLDMNRNRTVEGTGLGMSIVQRILEQMDSKLGVESVYGAGSRFFFSIEQKVMDRSPIGIIDVSKLKEEKEIEKEALFTAHRARVLAVDDTAVNLTVVRGLLKRTGVILDTASSGKECLEMCKTTKYDVILLDHRMPGLDGVETFNILRSEPGPNKDTPTVALTANAMPGIDDYYISNGFSGYLAKPINGARLEKMLIKIFPESLLDTDEDLAILLDEEEGIKACGSREIFMQVVADAVSNENLLAGELRDCIEKQDIKNYTIKVHALKNTARMMGAPGLSKEAYYLEKCGDEGREEAIYRKEGDLLIHFHKVVEKLKAKYDIGFANLPLIESPVLKEMLEVLLEFIRTFDFDRADDIIKEIKTFSLPKNIAEPFEKLGGAMYNYDADGVVKYAEECISLL